MDDLSPDRLKNLFNHLPMALVLFDDKGSVFYVNQVICQLTGYSQEELLGQGYYDLLFTSKESNQRMREKALASYELPYDDLELVIAVKSEVKINVKISGSSVKDSDKVFGLLILEDITRQKAMDKMFMNISDAMQQATNEKDSLIKEINEANRVLEEYKAKMIRELNIAKSVQKAIIPKTFPKIPGFDMFGVSIPSDELGGDYFDYFLLDEKTVGILIADVSGHGVPSSLITTMVKAYFEYYTKRFSKPDEVLQNVNRDMAAIIMDTGFYLTAFYCVLNTQTLDLTVSIAGHDSAICVTRGKSAIRLGEGAEGTILGIFGDAEFKSVTYKLEPDSKVIIYTDGITEARADSGEFYGSERLENFLSAQLGRPSQESVDSLIEEVNAFYGTNSPNDDRTLVIFDILPRSGGVFDPRESLKKGKKAFLEKDFAGAMEEFESLIKNGSQDSEVYSLAGQTAEYLRMTDKGIQYLEKSVSLDPQNFKAFYYLGYLYVNNNNPEAGAKAWGRVLDLAGDYKGTRNLLEKIVKKA